MTDEELSNLLESAYLQVCSTWTELREKLILAHGEIVRLRKEVSNLTDECEILKDEIDHVTTDRNNLSLAIDEKSEDRNSLFDENEILRVERDEARKEVCSWYGITKKVPKEEVAKEREWNIFEDNNG